MRLVVAGLVALTLVGCAGGVEEAEHEVAAVDEPVGLEPSLPDVVAARLENAEVEGQHLGWGGLWLSMRADRAREVLGDTLVIDETLDGKCPGRGAHVTLHGTELDLAFTGDGDDDVLQAIRVPLPGAAEAEAMVAALRQSVAGELVFDPSQTPEVQPDQTDRHLYVLSASPDQGVLLEPGEGMQIALVSCIE